MSETGAVPSHIRSFSSIDSVVASSRLNGQHDLPNGSRRPSLQPPVPSLTRAFSMPLQSQLGHLKRPARSISSRSEAARAPSPGDEAVEIAQELADSVQMVIQTLLQISPPHLLDPAKEQFSACALQIPTPSISALLTSMKNLNYMSKHMPSLVSSASQDLDMYSIGSSDNFDIGEVLQSVGDAVSGIAAEAGVEIVLFHSSVGLKHIPVEGDECGVCYTLSHVVRQVLAICQKEDVIEIELHLNPSVQDISTGDDTPKSLRAIFEITHKSGDSTPRDIPFLQGSTLQRLLGYTKATIQTKISNPEEQGSAVELAFDLQQSSATQDLTPSEEFTSNLDSKLAREPTLEELLAFADRLKGLKVAFHASSKSSFARHLTSYLTSWGMNVSHTQTDIASEQTGDDMEPGSAIASGGLPPKELSLSKDIGSTLPGIIIIDDDPAALRSHVSQFHLQHTHLAIPNRKRPSLGTNLRTRSTPFVTRAQPVTGGGASPAVVVHFTSLSNYKVVKDIVQAYLPWTSQHFGMLPEVIVIPKPAGPRRFLTALHTAITKPMIDPFFQPIATSPLSPSGHPPSPYFPPQPNQSIDRIVSSSGVSPNSTINPDAILTSSTSTKPALPSPLATEEIEYFSETANKLGNSASAGVLVQSPDGRPAGIFFQPHNTPVIRRQSLERPVSSRSQRSPLVSSRGSNSGDGSDLKISVTSSTPSGDETATDHVKTPRPRPSTDEIPAPIIASETDPVINVLYSTTPRNNTQSTTNRRGSATRPKLGSRPKKGSEIVPPINVLIVEDNPLQQTVLSTFMRRNKIRYGLANNGLEAVEKWRTGDYHLVLMDIQMPVMDGIQATQEIRRLESQEHMNYRPLFAGNVDRATPTSMEPQTPTTPFHSSVIIVALTASNLQSDRVAALAAGCNDFLVKPVALEWLEKKIIEWGSIKALQMWAENDVSPAFKQGQSDTARAVAEKLHIVRPKSRRQEGTLVPTT